MVLATPVRLRVPPFDFAAPSPSHSALARIRATRDRRHRPHRPTLDNLATAFRLLAAYTRRGG